MHDERINNKYIMLTPAGAFAITNQEEGGAGFQLLLNILSEPTTPLLAVDTLKRLSGLEAGEALSLLAKLQSSALVQTLDEPISCSNEPLERLLPQLISALSDKQITLLADPQGFYMANSGFEQREGEELAAISATLATISKRHSKLFNDSLAVPSRAWALADPAGNSELGFWPLFVGQHRFSLVIAGKPCFNQTAFVELIWALTSRYANEGG